MKRLKFLSLFFLAGFAASTVLTSCGDETDEPKPKPTITVTNPSGGTASVTTGDTLSVTVTASANEELSSFKVTQSTNGGAPGTLVDSTLEKNLTSYTFEAGFIVGNTAATIVYTFEVTDKEGESNTATLEVTVTEPEATINEYSARMMGGQTNATLGSFMDADLGVVYKSADVETNQATVDLVYFFGTSNQATLAAPDDTDANTAHSGNSSLENWTTKNDTRFSTTTMTPAEFDAVNDASEIQAETVAATETKLNMLDVDQVGAFVTADGKSGLFKVVSITGTSGSDRAIEIEVKIEK